MSTLNNNNTREDAVFKRKVKDVLLRNAGPGGLVNVLDDFNARDAAAAASASAPPPDSTRLSTGNTYRVTTGQRGMGYKEFLAFVDSYGVELTSFEGQYLCRSFDDAGDGHISATTFTRHLTGLNARRHGAVRQVWQAVLAKHATAVNGSSQCLPRSDVFGTYSAVQAQRTSHIGAPTVFTESMRSTPEGQALLSTFTDEHRQQLRSTYLASTDKPASRSAAPQEDEDDVTYGEFLAFYAGISAYFPSDEGFEAHLLGAWAADDTRRPVLHETQREWRAEGDPLALDGPHYVKDALDRQLGRSSKSYNYSHMQRTPPYVEPLPPLNRLDIMTTTMQKTYAPYDVAAQTLADPLATRRGQLS